MSRAEEPDRGVPGGKSIVSPGPLDALKASRRLTRDELLAIRCSVERLTPGQRDRYFTELAFLLSEDLLSVHTALNQNQAAIKEFDASARASLNEIRGTIEKFDKASRRLTRWLIGLTVVLIILTGAIAWFTILLARRG